MTSPGHPHPLDESTPASATDGPPAQQHGDPLLAASEGAQEGTEGSRHGLDADSAARTASERPETG